MNNQKVNNQYPEENDSTSHENNFFALIVDDEADIGYLLTEILREKKIKADYVPSLSEAIVFLQKKDPFMIFLDNKLSDGFGVDHVHEFKAKHPHTRIIMMSAYDNAADREKAYMEGADYFISKPFTRRTILEAVEN